MKNTILDGIYQEVDGFYYWEPHVTGGCYAAHTLREIADALDEKNKGWMDAIDKMSTHENQTDHSTENRSQSNRG